jgi:hypothetical protein
LLQTLMVMKLKYSSVMATTNRTDANDKQIYKSTVSEEMINETSSN